IRDFHVTGVQTCALPISQEKCTRRCDSADVFGRSFPISNATECPRKEVCVGVLAFRFVPRRRYPGVFGLGIRSSKGSTGFVANRSEERRVGNDSKARSST